MSSKLLTPIEEDLQILSKFKTQNSELVTHNGECKN